MLYSKEGKISIEGRKVVLQSELCNLINVLLNECNFTKEDFIQCIELGMLSDEELDTAIEEMFKETIKELQR